MHCLKIRITSHQVQLNNKIIYVVEVKDEISVRSKITKLRYSEFRDIHEEIQRCVQKLKLHINLPQFPGRKMFGATNKSQESIIERKKDLKNYLNDLLTIQRLMSLGVVRKNYIPLPEGEQTNLNEDLNMQICIDKYTIVDDVVIYYVRLRDLTTHEEWTYKARYSEIRNVHESLEQIYGKNIPVFPKKKIFGITNQSPQDIERRRDQLEKYLSEIFSNKKFINGETLRYYIAESKKEAEKQKYFQTMRKKKRQI